VLITTTTLIVFFLWSNSNVNVPVHCENRVTSCYSGSYGTARWL